MSCSGRADALDFAPEMSSSERTSPLDRAAHGPIAGARPTISIAIATCAPSSDAGRTVPRTGWHAAPTGRGLKGAPVPMTPQSTCDQQQGRRRVAAGHRRAAPRRSRTAPPRAERAHYRGRRCAGRPRARPDDAALTALHHHPRRVPRSGPPPPRAPRGRDRASASSRSLRRGMAAQPGGRGVGERRAVALSWRGGQAAIAADGVPAPPAFVAFLRASMALTLFTNAFSSFPLPTVRKTSSKNRPLKFLPSRTTT
jgi:hypothetical protein